MDVLDRSFLWQIENEKQVVNAKMQGMANLIIALCSDMP